MSMLLMALMQGAASGRRALVLLGVVALIGELALRWDWLVEVGLAPIVLSIAWCAAVTGLGICMIKSDLRKRRSNATATAHAVVRCAAEPGNNATRDD